MPFCRDCYVNVAAIVFSGDAQVTLKRVAPWLECRTRDQKVAGSSPGRSGRLIFFSRVNFLCGLLFRYPFHPRVTAVVRKRFCHSAESAGSKLQLNTHAPLYMALHDET